MNLKILEESSKRSKSLKRYSLNRKIKEKERKEQMTKSVEDGMQSLSCASACGTDDAIETRENIEKDISCLKMRKEDFTGKHENVTSAAAVTVVSQELTIGTVKKLHQPAHSVNTYVTLQRSSPVISVRPDIKNPLMAPCGPAALRSIRIASPMKNSPSKQPQSPFPAQAQCTGYPPNYLPHPEHFQAAPRYFPAPNLPYNGNSTMHLTFMNIPQNNPVAYAHTYMTPFQSPGFHASQIAHTQVRMQRSREAYNAFTAYGHPFGVFWSRQN